MKPSEVATRLGIAASTIRAWSLGEFKLYLSPGAQGGSGKNRNLNEQDVAIIALIAQLKQEGATTDDIHLTLKTLQSNDWQDLPPAPDNTPHSANVPVVPKAAADGVIYEQRRLLLRENETLREQLDELRAQLDAERTDREKLLREIAEIQVKLATSETELNLWRSGRLKPADDD